MKRPEDKGVHDLEGVGYFGDSGSPALIKNKDGKWNIGGVNSWVNRLGYEAKAGYARLGGVAYNWIMENIAFDEDGEPKPWKKADKECDKFERGLG